MDGLESILRRGAERPGALTHGELARLVWLRAPEERVALYAAALAVKERVCGKAVHLRGLVEIGNVCAKDCYYCGIRRSNEKVRRYRIAEADVVRMARWAWKHRYGSVVLQSGELEGEAHTAEIARIVRGIREFGGESFEIVLSLGEQSEETYRRWREAGTARYLLRIETANPALYRTLHPDGHSWERRRECLRSLRRLGYQVGSGVMIGLPGQTADDLAGDLEFFRDEDIDMIGMGPFVPHPDTPMGGTPIDMARQLELGLNMVATARLFLHDRNIAATTVLQTLADDGREQALLAGANVLMPNVTDVGYRKDYLLYAGKPCIEESGAACELCLAGRVAKTGQHIAWGEPGPSPHYRARMGQGGTPAQ